jgi:membrane peptidoglycan carboxypeptidase
VILILFFGGIGAIGALALVGVYTSLASNLPPTSDLTNVVLSEESIIYDRTGEVELARFGDARREVVTFDEIPPIIVDATTAVEDKTFWENAGFDPLAIISAALDSLRGNSRGASTITQQLVRNRLLPSDLVQDPTRTAERKLKEIIQSIRVTQAYPGEDGKREIITAYLNQNYYGNQSYGVKAAYESYFGKPFDAENVTPAEAAIIAGLPKSPSNYDLVRNAIERCTTTVEEGTDCPAGKSELTVPEETTVVQRRNDILDLLAQGDRTPISEDTYSSSDFEAAKLDEVVLASQTAARWVAPHFVWAVRDELTEDLCGPDAETCDPLERGGLRITTTLDARLQKIAEKWVRASAIVPHQKNPEAAAKALGFKSYPAWMANLENKNVRNGALVAVDYQSGELVAYVGSANYYSTSTNKRFQPQYDVVGQGYRQPGSAFKPFNYAIGIDDQKLTAGTMFMDTGTDFNGYTPSDADRLERGPVRVRNALQFSLNIPSVKAMAVNGVSHVFDRAKDFGMTFQSDTSNAGLAFALGVQEVRPVDLVTAYGTLANGGVRVDHTTILSVKDRSGTDVLGPKTPPAGVQVVSPQTAFIVTDILAGNTNKNINPFWGKFDIQGPEGRRSATLKTGTNNDARDLNAYGYIAPPTDDGRADGAYALAVGVWNGNSDNTPVSTPSRPVFSIDVSTYVWQGFLEEASKQWPETRFQRPADGLTRVEIDPWTGLKASGGGDTVNEWFISGTEPRETNPADTCGTDLLSTFSAPRAYENQFPEWMTADRDWLRRAAKGPGTVGGPERTRTAYFYNGAFRPFGGSWGALVSAGCGSPSPSPSCIPLPTPDASGVIPSQVIPSPSGSEIVALPCPTPSASASESVPPSEVPTPTPTPTPEVTPTPTPEVTPTPTPEVTPTPTPIPSP